MRGQLLFTPAESQFVKDIITQVRQCETCKLMTDATKRSSLQANKTYGDLEPNISMLKIYASLGFRAEELSHMEEEFEILNVRGRHYTFPTHVESAFLSHLHNINLNSVLLDGALISGDACFCTKSSYRHRLQYL